MNGANDTPETAAPAPEATPIPEAPKPAGPQENTDAVLEAFKACSDSLKELHINDVKKVLSALTTVHFGR